MMHQSIINGFFFSFYYRINQSIDNKDVVTYVASFPRSNITVTKIGIYVSIFIVVDKSIKNASKNTDAKDSAIILIIISAIFQLVYWTYVADFKSLRIDLLLFDPVHQ